MSQVQIIDFDDFIGSETVDREYKEFTFNYTGTGIDNRLAENYCKSNEFIFNEQVIQNTKKCLKCFVPKYISGFLNSNINGTFLLGVNDFGYVKGIPFSGKIPIKYFKDKIFKIANKHVQCWGIKNGVPNINPTFDYRNYIKVKFIKINKPARPSEPYSRKFQQFLIKREEYYLAQKQHAENLQKWRVRFSFVNQKLIDIVNNYETRIVLIDYIKKRDPDNSVIDLLLTDYKLEYRNHENVSMLKEVITNPYYWVTRWKDEMIAIVRSEKPKPPDFNYQNTPINLIVGSSEMIPHWTHYNEDMNLYVIQIQIMGSKLFRSKKGYPFLYYYDTNGKKWLSCQRGLLPNGDPVCFPY